MSIQHIKQTHDLKDLESLGTVAIPLSEPACALHGKKVAIPGADDAQAGVWECSPGQFRRQVTRGEVMHILSGVCTFTPDDGEPLHIQAGDTLFMSPNTNGVWDIKSAIRKVYTLL